MKYGNMSVGDQELHKEQVAIAARELGAPMEEIENGLDSEYWHRDRCVSVEEVGEDRFNVSRVYEY